MKVELLKDLCGLKKGEVYDIPMHGAFGMIRRGNAKAYTPKKRAKKSESDSSK